MPLRHGSQLLSVTNKEISDSRQSLEVCHSPFNQMPGKQVKKPWELDFRLLMDPDLLSKAFLARNEGQHPPRTPPKKSQWAVSPGPHGFLEPGNGLSSYRWPGSGLGLFSPLTPSACPDCRAPILTMWSRPHSNWVTIKLWHWPNNPIGSFKTHYWVLEMIRGTTLNHRDAKASKTVPLSWVNKLDKELRWNGAMGVMFQK